MCASQLPPENRKVLAMSHGCGLWALSILHFIDGKMKETYLKEKQRKAEYQNLLVIKNPTKKLSSLWEVLWAYIKNIKRHS